MGEAMFKATNTYDDFIKGATSTQAKGVTKLNSTLQEIE
jgi:hypothetical protein